MAITILYREELKEYDFGSVHSFGGDPCEIFPKFLKEHIPEDGNYLMLESEPATDEEDKGKNVGGTFNRQELSI